MLNDKFLILVYVVDRISTGYLANPLNFTVDHPFLFFLHHESGILMVGRINSIEADES